MHSTARSRSILALLVCGTTLVLGNCSPDETTAPSQLGKAPQTVSYAKYRTANDSSIDPCWQYYVCVIQGDSTIDAVEVQCPTACFGPYIAGMTSAPVGVTWSTIDSIVNPNGSSHPDTPSSEFGPP